MNVLQNFKIKKRVLYSLLLFISLQSFALSNKNSCAEHKQNSFEFFFCDLCSCSSSGGNFGLGTLNNVPFVGVRFIHQSFVSKDGIFTNSPTSKEYFNTYQHWGKLPITERFYISAILPYQDLTRKFNDRTEAINGLGDATIMGWYQLKLFKKADESKADYVTIAKEPSKHSLEFGLGVKLPTGKFEEVLTNRVNPGFQVGTGSVDAIFAVSHNYTFNKFGLNNALTYYLKGENKNQYRFGNQFSYASNLFYSIMSDTYNLIPFIGVSGNFYESISQFGETIQNTSGNVFNASFGAEITLRNFIVGANYTTPMSSNLFGNNVTPKDSLSVYLNFVLE